MRCQTQCVRGRKVDGQQPIPQAQRNNTHKRSRGPPRGILDAHISMSTSQRPEHDMFLLSGRNLLTGG